MKLRRNGYSEDGRCKLCGRDDSWNHFASCDHEGLVKHRERLINNLKSKMEKLKANPFLTYWLLETLRGAIPKMEKVTPLGLEMRVKAAFDGKNMIGWLHLPKGRVTGKMVTVQEWWDKEHLEGKLKDRDARHTVEKILGLAMLVRYEIWKVRCEEVAKISLPTKIQVQWDKIEKLKMNPEDVEA